MYLNVRPVCVDHCSITVSYRLPRLAPRGEKHNRRGRLRRDTAPARSPVAAARATGRHQASSGARRAIPPGSVNRMPGDTTDSPRPYRRPSLQVVPLLVTLAIAGYVLFSPAAGLPPVFPHSDKVVHALLFAALSSTARIAGHHPFVAALWTSIFGLLSEVIQARWIVGRSGTLGDLAADILGVLLGLLVYRVAARRYRRRERMRADSRSIADS